MKYARLKGNGQLEHAPNELQIEDYDITNPSHEDYLRAGYKEYVQTLPESRNWYMPIPKYSETETQIIQEWEYVKVPEPDYKSLLVSKIREQYDIDDEFAVRDKGRIDELNPEFVAFISYRESCKEWARGQIREWEEA